MAEQILEVEYTNDRHHTAFMTGQITCQGGGAGRIVAELFDPDGKRRLGLAAGTQQQPDSNSDVACNTLTLPVPPRWTAKCYRLEAKTGIETSWAEID